MSHSQLCLPGDVWECAVSGGVSVAVLTRQEGGGTFCSLHRAQVSGEARFLTTKGRREQRGQDIQGISPAALDQPGFVRRGPAPTCCVGSAVWVRGGSGPAACVDRHRLCGGPGHHGLGARGVRDPNPVDIEGRRGFVGVRSHVPISHGTGVGFTLVVRG